MSPAGNEHAIRTVDCRATKCDWRESTVSFTLPMDPVCSICLTGNIGSQSHAHLPQCWMRLRSMYSVDHHQSKSRYNLIWEHSFSKTLCSVAQAVGMPIWCWAASCGAKGYMYACAVRVSWLNEFNVFYHIFFMVSSLLFIFLPLRWSYGNQPWPWANPHDCWSRCSVHFIHSRKFQSSWKVCMKKICHVNPLWTCGQASDAIWQHWSGWTLAQVVTCCLMAPSHYLN